MRNPLKTPRKNPAQSRSADLVASIFEASVRILKTVGGAKFSTRKIAELAGVSVGSLYQYFPNKESIIGALIEREAKRHVDLLEKKFAEIQNQSFEVVIKTLITELIHTVQRDRALLRAILSSTFVTDRLDSIIEAREHMITFVSRILETSGVSASAPSPRVTAYTICAALGGVVETIIFRKTEPFSDQVLIEEVSRMVHAYCLLPEAP